MLMSQQCNNADLAFSTLAVKENRTDEFPSLAGMTSFPLMPIQGPIPFPPRKKRRTSPRWPWFVLLAFALSALALVGWVASDWSLLVKDTPGARARWALVLAGEGTEADRTQAGLALIQTGRVDSLVVSGTPVVGSLFSSAILLSALPQETDVRRRVLEAQHTSRSTVEEAQALIPMLQALGADTVVLVTSNFHTRRAASVFQAIAPEGMHFLPISSPSFYFAQGWSSREGAKAWLLEWTKTLWWHLKDRWSTLPLQANAAKVVRFPEAGRLGEPCPICPAPTVCPPAPTCPQVAATPEPKPEPKPAARKLDKPKKKKDKAAAKR
jgi:uncharacterized SAM-binding protein YcdF (DUF218 family)